MYILDGTKGKKGNLYIYFRAVRKLLLLMHQIFIVCHVSGTENTNSGKSERNFLSHEIYIWKL